MKTTDGSKMEGLLYKSTRTSKSGIVSSEAVVRGIAPDGGLYVPVAFPQIERTFDELSGYSYKKLAFYVMSKFFTDFDDEDLADCIEKAYDEKFDTPEIAPVINISDLYFLELYHGATLAFKDMALSLLPHLLTSAVKNLAIDKEIVILTATSGDTGKAALESFSDVQNTRIIVFYPKEGVSKIQERQMITQEGSNTSVIAIKGNFDDAQNGVKEIFSDKSLAKDMEANGYMFSSANSINIGRLIPQIVYYIHAYLKLMKYGAIDRGQKINIVVPTGNFGNILAAYYSHKMGLPVARLICASNENNILYDFLTTGVYDKRRELILTSSPSMDILISSNLERLLYDLSGNDPLAIQGLMDSLKEKGVFKIEDSMIKKLDMFYGQYATEPETFSTIEKVFKEHDYLIDTHTAVGCCVYGKYRNETKDDTPSVLASTASPFKFPAAVLCSLDPGYKGLDDFELIKKLSEVTGRQIPAPLKDMDKKPVLHDTVCSRDDMILEVKKILGI